MRKPNVSLDWIREHIADGSVKQFEILRCADYQIHLRCVWFNRDKNRIESVYSNKFIADLVLAFAHQMARNFNGLMVDKLNNRIYYNDPL